MAVGVPAATAPSSQRAQQGFMARLDSPLASYYLVLGASVTLVLLGLLMVLSSSSVESLATTGSSYAVFVKQARFAAIGAPLMALAVRLPVRAWKALAWPGLAVAFAGLALVTVMGHAVNGNQNWVQVGPVTVQPSEAAKLALIVWGAAVLARKRPLLGSSLHALVPVVVPVAVGMLGLVLVGHDLGTALVLMGLTGALIWVAGAPLRVFVLAGALAAAAMAVLVQGSHSRMTRIQSWVGGDCTDYLNACWQATHGKWALATGGWWGVGLGASRQKWGLLPEAHNDFIFAIIGEELGLAGTLAVIMLFALLGIGLYRVVAHTEDIFVKIATGGVLAWVLGQALVNIGAVVGLLPVVGLPLPLVSSGGSALVSTMVALGMVVGFARHEPSARRALAARPGLVRRSLAVIPMAVASHTRGQGRVARRLSARRGAAR